MKIKVKRVYERAEKSDGARVLADRLWPRGMSRAQAQIDVWAKELAPSKELRAWLHDDPDRRYHEFQKRYRAELARNRARIEELLPRNKTITLITAVKNIERSHIPVLRDFLEDFEQ